MRKLDKYLRHFYKIFHIKPIQLDYPDNIPEYYPEITDEMYIKLLLLNIKLWQYVYILKSTNKTDLKCEILFDCCFLVNGMNSTSEKNKYIKKIQKILKDVK